jgi:hypothetical protein
VEIVRNGTMHVGRRQVKTVRTDVNVVHTVCVRILQQYILTPTRTLCCVRVGVNIYCCEVRTDVVTTEFKLCSTTHFSFG